MLFNSYEFILGFLPLVAIGFYLVGMSSQRWALRWLILMSLVFYAWWRPFNLLILGPSLLVNFALAHIMMRAHARHATPSRAVLVIGIAFNVAVLGYFKYANFFVDAASDVFGTRFTLTQIILPLGISFITFQKIAFLVDVHAQRVKTLSFQEYCLFVLFFPQLIAGPIVHYRELLPQFQTLTCRFDQNNVSAGLTLFVFGLFKKTVLADGIAPHVSTLYEQANAGAALSLFPAWMAAIGFTLQIYFDFSAYTDMALGAARMLGVRLPPNFDSPLRASSIIEFWSRWHMSLTRFLTAYVYNPLALSLARRRLKRQHGVDKRKSVGAFSELLMVPTLATMLISGIWHGAGYLFILWCLLHGAFLVVNHAWREFRGVPGVRHVAPTGFRPFGFLLTSLSVVVSMVIFRAPTLHAAVAVFHGMLGLDGVALPQTLYARLG